jgi:glycosyltransferase involved in cell wall biosynthesis
MSQKMLNSSKRPSVSQHSLKKRPAEIQGGLSIVVPLYNEAENVEPLVVRLHEVLGNYEKPWEVILVDDGSRDDTLENAEKASQQYGSHVRVVALQRNFGQTAAMQAGIDFSRGGLIVTMDGDLQNDPQDIPRMIAHLESHNLNMLSGWRKKRRDKMFMRKLPSWIANRIIGAVTGVKLHDYGCSLKIYRATVIKQVTLFGEMHRFIPAWVATVVPPTKIGEIEVHHNPRRMGKSKYGIDRSFRVVLDLISAYFFMRYKARPGHFFGSFGFLFGLMGAVILTYLAIEKFYFGEDIGTRPLLLIGVVCIIAAVQFITTGVLSEMMARIYFEASDKKSYIVRSTTDSESIPDDEGWYRPTHENNDVD